MANIYKKSLAAYGVWREMLSLTRGFRMVLDVHNVKSNDRATMLEAQRQFRDNVRSKFTPVGHPEVNMHDREFNQLWDRARAEAMGRWIGQIGPQVCEPLRAFPFHTFLQTLAYASEVTTQRNQAPASNKALTTLYARLLPIASHPEHNELRVGAGRSLELYIGQLRTVWDAAGSYPGHQAAMAQELLIEVARTNAYRFWPGVDGNPVRSAHRSEILGLISENPDFKL